MSSSRGLGCGYQPCQRGTSRGMTLAPNLGLNLNGWATFTLSMLSAAFGGYPMLSVNDGNVVIEEVGSSTTEIAGFGKEAERGVPKSRSDKPLTET